MANALSHTYTDSTSAAQSGLIETSKVQALITHLCTSPWLIVVPFIRRCSTMERLIRSIIVQHGLACGILGTFYLLSREPFMWNSFVTRKFFVLRLLSSQKPIRRSGFLIPFVKTIDRGDKEKRTNLVLFLRRILSPLYYRWNGILRGFYQRLDREANYVIRYCGLQTSRTFQMKALLFVFRIMLLLEQQLVNELIDSAVVF